MDGSSYDLRRKVAQVDFFHRLVNDLIGIEGLSEELYSLFGHGRWVQLFAPVLQVAHVVSPSGITEDKTDMPVNGSSSRS